MSEPIHPHELNDDPVAKDAEPQPSHLERINGYAAKQETFLATLRAHRNDPPPKLVDIADINDRYDDEFHG